MAVTVVPEQFSLVDFDAGEIRAITERLVEQLGISADVRVEVDETVPFGRARVTSTDPIVIEVESGAFEDPKRPRELSTDHTAEVIGRLLLRVRDRLSEGFGTPPPDDEIPMAKLVAWDAYCLGRLARLGYRDQSPRRRYHFRNRHGFTDAADAAFDVLWNAEELTWDDIVRISDDALSVAPVPPPGADKSIADLSKPRIPQRSKS